MKFVSATIDGVPVPQNALALDDEGLTVAAEHVPDGFVWEAETEIAPEANTALEGLYMSRGMYCTQCEAEGFRKITYFPDRPDVMARFRVRVEGDAPVLLSNGNLVAPAPAGRSGRTRSRSPAICSRWSRATCVAVEDSFTTRSGRDVLLQILGARRRRGPLRLRDERAEAGDGAGTRRTTAASTTSTAS